MQQATVEPVTVYFPVYEVKQTVELTERFASYLKRVENAGNIGYRNGKWYVFRVSSTELNIGYGHKVKTGEHFRNGLTQNQVEKLLADDVKAAQLKAKEYVDGEFGINAFNKLDEVRKEMLTDFAFNTGTLELFPKFVQAVIHNNILAMKFEYERTAVINGIKKSIGRNADFYETYLKNYNGGFYVASSEFSFSRS